MDIISYLLSAFPPTHGEHREQKQRIL